LATSPPHPFSEKKAPVIGVLAAMDKTSVFVLVLAIILQRWLNFRPEGGNTQKVSLHHVKEQIFLFKIHQSDGSKQYGKAMQCPYKKNLVKRSFARTFQAIAL
jgi:hypothetical protein